MKIWRSHEILARVDALAVRARGAHRRRADAVCRVDSAVRSDCAQRGRHITIETAGTLYLPVACDLMSISPKLAELHARPRARAALARSGTSARAMRPR